MQVSKQQQHSAQRPGKGMSIKVTRASLTDELEQHQLPSRASRERGHSQVANDRTTQARIDRDLRYWTSRRSFAQLVVLRTIPVVHFGCTVTIARDAKRRNHATSLPPAARRDPRSKSPVAPRLFMLHCDNPLAVCFGPKDMSRPGRIEP